MNKWINGPTLNYCWDVTTTYLPSQLRITYHTSNLYNIRRNLLRRIPKPKPKPKASKQQTANLQSINTIAPLFLQNNVITTQSHHRDRILKYSNPRIYNNHTRNITSRWCPHWYWWGSDDNDDDDDPSAASDVPHLHAFPNSFVFVRNSPDRSDQK